MPWSQRLNRLHCKGNISAFQVLPPLPCLPSWHSEKIHTPSIWLLCAAWISPLLPRTNRTGPRSCGSVQSLSPSHTTEPPCAGASPGSSWVGQEGSVSLMENEKQANFYKKRKKKKKKVLSPNWKSNLNSSTKLCQLSDKYTAICWAVSGSFSHLKVLILHKNVALRKTTLSWKLKFSVRQFFQ